MCANLLAGLEHFTGGKLIVLEDDDWIAPGYLQAMSALLDAADLAGFAPATYYNLRRRVLRHFTNGQHCSLGQTGLTAAAVPCLERACRSEPRFVDLDLWKNWTGTRRIAASNGMHLSIKSMPGARGIGDGHDYLQGTPDPHFHGLRRFLGSEAEPYIEIAEGEVAGSSSADARATS
jgi:hypothetical protein